MATPENLLENEILKPIIGYENIYGITNFGRIWSYPKLTPGGHGSKWLKSRRNKYGYIHIGLCNKGKQNDYLIHRLVALSFIPNPDNLPQVNHKDGNKQNNHVDNLEWCTTKENSLHAWKNGLIKSHLHTEEHKRYMSNLYKGAGNPFYGRTHSLETKQKFLDNRIK